MPTIRTPVARALVLALLFLSASRPEYAQATAAATAPPAAGQDTAREAAEAPQAFYQRAWHLETADGKVEEALAMYRGLAALAEVPSSLRAKALYRAAICLRKLRRPDEAADTFRRIKGEFPDAVEVVQAAERELAEESLGDAIVRRKCEEILFELWTANRNPAASGESSRFQQLLGDLDAVGPRAAPHIVDVITAAEPHPATDHLAATLTRFAASDAGVAAVVRRLLREARTELRLDLLEVQPLLRGDEWRDLLVELAGDEEDAVRAAAAGALGTYADAPAHQALAALLGDENATVRSAAIEALAQNAGEADLARFRAAYEDAEPAVRAAAVAAVRATLERLSTPAPERTRSVVAPAVHVATLERLATPAPDLGAEAALLAGAPDIVLGELIELFGAYPRALRAGGVAALARRIDEIRGMAAAPPRRGRRGAPAGPRPAPYELAVNVLVESGDPAALPVLLAVLERREVRVIEKALEGVAALRDPRAVPALVALLEEDTPEATAGAEPRAPARSPNVRTPQTPPRSPRGFAPGQETAWRLLAETFWNDETLALVAERLNRFPELFEIEALRRVLDSGRPDLAEKVFANYAELDRQGRYTVLEHRAFERAADASVLAVLARALLDEENAIREKAASQVGRFPSPELIEALARSWEDSKRRDWRDVLSRIVEGISRIDDRRVLPVLLDALAGKEKGVAEKAANRFPEAWVGPETTASLLALVTSPTTFYPEMPAAVLAKLARPSDAESIARALPAAPAEVRPALAAILGKLGEDVAVPALRAEIGGDLGPIVEESIEALGAIGTPAAADALVAALADERREVREWAIVALRRDAPALLGSIEDAAERLAPAIADEDAGVRLHAAEVLGEIEGANAAMRLAGMLTDPHNTVRAAAATNLAASPRPAIAPLIAAALATEGTPEVARALASALLAHDVAVALPALVARLRAMHGSAEDDLEIKTDIIARLRGLPARPVADAAIPLLAEVRDETVGAAVLRLVIGLDDPRAADVLIRHIDHDEIALRRVAVAEAGRVLDRRALPALIERLRDPDTDVRNFARGSIERIRFYEEQRQLAGAAAPADRALAELLGLLASPEPAVRRAAVEALARTESAKALPAIVKLRKDVDPLVREAVERALDALAE